MNELVYIEPARLDAEPFTTSEVIAECAGVKHHAIQQMISKYETEIKNFGVIAFEMRKPPASSKGGRPEIIYRLNESQATFVLTLLKNTPVVVAFKVELVRQFYAMREELHRRKELRIEGKPKRRSLTDAIRDSGEAERMHGHAYSAYSNLAYKLATGKSAAQLREERGAERGAIAADFLTAAEMEAYQKRETAIAALLDVGLTYEGIKAALFACTK